MTTQTYTILYTYLGEGKAVVEARSEREAKEKFYEGECEYKDDGWDYEIDTISTEEKKEHDQRIYKGGTQ